MTQTATLPLTQAVITIQLNHGDNAYPVAIGAPRSIEALRIVNNRYVADVWVDQSVTPGACNLRVASMGESVPLNEGTADNPIPLVLLSGKSFPDGARLFTTCFGALPQ
jgi:hypothetical protein